MKVQLIETTQEMLQLSAVDALVPTMGNLHAGHLALVEQALRENETVVVSIFVNPTQFGAGEDFERYPRTLKEDQKRLTTLAQNYAPKRLIIFAPREISEIYGDHPVEVVDMGELATILCGRQRPDHFRGVTTVVNRLFEIIRPRQAYFGEKDFQQLFLIKKMVAEKKLPITIKSFPTIREATGLALSSRNGYLDAKEKQRALELYQALKWIKDHIDDYCLSDLAQQAKEQGQERSWDYLEILDAQTLGAVHPQTEELLVAGALRIGATRLIDNLTFLREGHALAN